MISDPTENNVFAMFELIVNKIFFKFFGYYSVPCLKTLIVIFMCVLVLIMRTSLFVNIRTSSLVKSAH